MKDEDGSVTSVMSNLFSPLSKKRVKEMGLCEMEENRYVGRLSADVDACGSTDRVAVGAITQSLHLGNKVLSLARLF